MEQIVAHIDEALTASYLKHCKVTLSPHPTLLFLHAASMMPLALFRGAKELPLSSRREYIPLDLEKAGLSTNWGAGETLAMTVASHLGNRTFTLRLEEPLNHAFAYRALLPTDPFLQEVALRGAEANVGRMALLAGTTRERVRRRAAASMEHDLVGLTLVGEVKVPGLDLDVELMVPRRILFDFLVPESSYARDYVEHALSVHQLSFLMKDIKKELRATIGEWRTAGLFFPPTKRLKNLLATFRTTRAALTRKISALQQTVLRAP